MAYQKNIFLIGPMGAGKSAVGRHLARALHMEFVDSDDEIEARTGVDIPFIFEKEGEAGFRKREAAVIDELSQREGVVLATGGGAIVNEKSRQHLAARGLVVYLRTSIEQQLERTSRGRERPMLAGGDQETVLRELFAVREPLYLEIADLTVETDRRRVGAVAEEIRRAL